MEKTFYHDSKISVTSTRIAVHGESLPLEEITSTEETVDYPGLISFPVIVLVGAVIGSVAEFLRGNRDYALFCALLALLAALRLTLIRESYTISVVGPDRSVEVFVSRNKNLARVVRTAIEVAISHRLASDRLGKDSRP